MSKMNDLFDNLRNWKKLPAYQAERRSDLFFSLYVAEAIHDHLDGKPKMLPKVVPEFPLRKKEGNQSDKVDYLAATADGKELILVELKTDEKSIRSEQMKYLARPYETKPPKWMGGLIPIQKASKEKKKYEDLFKVLKDINLHVEKPDAAPIDCRVVFIKPSSYIDPKKFKVLVNKNIPFEVISFLDFAKTVEKSKDDFSKEFAALLREWGEEAEKS